MRIYKTQKGNYLLKENRFYPVQKQWDELVNTPDLFRYLEGHTADSSAEQPFSDEEILAPVGNQEVWAAGVTYLKSRDARMEESKPSGGADLYDKVYEAERPELFFKSTGEKVVGPGKTIYIRRDSEWNVPEPELTLFIDRTGIIQGYTVGNDVSSRSIEGENALYLPQAKVYDHSAAIGPCLLIADNGFDLENKIHLTISRSSETMYQDTTPVSRMKRSLEELAAFLYRENSFKNGCYLMTGTCLVPPATFTLQPGDVVEISIDEIGTLKNTVSCNPKLTASQHA